MRKYIQYLALSLIVSTVFSANADTMVDFFRAVRADNDSGVRKLIEQGFDPNTRDEHKQTGLILAMREPSPRVIDVLLASPKVDVSEVNGSDESALMMASLKGQKDVVEKLLARDAAVNKTGWAPLHYAATSGNVEIMKILLEKSAFIDAQSPNGTTPLMMAAMYGSAEAVKLLLDEGADTAMKNQQNMTAADFAERGKRPDAIALLANAPKGGAKPKAPSDGKW